MAEGRDNLHEALVLTDQQALDYIAQAFMKIEGHEASRERLELILEQAKEYQNAGSPLNRIALNNYLQSVNDSVEAKRTTIPSFVDAWRDRVKALFQRRKK